MPSSVDVRRDGMRAAPVLMASRTTALREAPEATRARALAPTMA